MNSETIIVLNGTVTLNLQVDPTGTAPALILRRWHEGDIDDLIAAYEDPDMRHWLKTRIDDEPGARRWLELQDQGWESGDRLTFAIVEDGTAVGLIVIRDTSADHDVPTAELGYWTLAAARGRGIASRTVEAVSQWLFGPQNVIPVKELELFHTIGNDASCRVAEKSGYAFESMRESSAEYPTQGHRHVRLK